MNQRRFDYDEDIIVTLSQNYSKFERPGLQSVSCNVS
jgi:hypothetical protein